MIIDILQKDIIELKHRTISPIEQETLVIGVLKTISNMLECKSRGAYLMGITYGKYEIENQVNFTVYVPKVDEHFVLVAWQ